MSELKPCPFCGEDNIHDEPSCIYPISCPKCGAEASQTVWNTRTEDKRITELESDTSALSAQVNYLDSRAWTSEQRIKELQAQLEQARGLPRFNVEPPYPSGGNLRIIAAKDGQWVRADELAAIKDKA